MESGHAERLHDLARQFRDYLIHQTGVDLIDIEIDTGDGAAGVARGPDALRAALERLDAALGQLADLQSVYSDAPAGSLEPMVFPIAALAGEYVRAMLGGEWSEPEDAPAGDEALVMVVDGESVDLLAVARAAVLSGEPGLSRMVR